MTAPHRALLDWLDHRTGCRGLVHAALYENIPGGSNWKYVWGSTLVFAFFVQMVTGIVLWMGYSPSTQTAWESVYYIQNEMQGGALLRGLHHYMAQAMIVLLALHLMQVVICGAYRAPREINFWIGLVLMLIVMGLGLTGYLLPWDQKGYWATGVATNIMGLAGEPMQRLAVGGSEYGHHTLTRFFALHAGLLPGLLMGLVAVHLALFRRHGLHAPNPAGKPDEAFWPDQILKDAVASLAVLAVVMGLALWRPAELGAPADPANPYDAARPEWYFLFLFQFLKYFTGGAEFWGAVAAPAGVMALIALMPILGRWKLGHVFNVSVLLILLLGVGLLTAQAYYDDHRAEWSELDPEKFPNDPRRQQQYAEAHRASENYLSAVARAEQEAERAHELAAAPAGIPPAGMVSLLRADPKTQGPILFARHCAACHAYTDARGLHIAAAETPTAPNLGDFGTRRWLAGLLDPAKIRTEDYFGGAAHLKQGDMVGFVMDTVSDLSDDEKADLAKVAAAVSAEADLPSQRDQDARDVEIITAGKDLLVNDFGCADCHRFHEEGDLGMAPDLTGWGSRAWLIGMIGDPGGEHFYGHLDADAQPMPAFAPSTDEPSRNILSRRDIELIVDWLRGDWYEPAGQE